MNRFKRILIALFVLAGMIAVFALIKAFFPSWVYWTCFFGFLAYVIWDLTKTERTHYWLYHSIIREEERITIGVLKNNKPTFSLTGNEFDIKKSLIFTAVEIDKETFEMIDKAINEVNEQSND